MQSVWKVSLLSIAILLPSCATKDPKLSAEDAANPAASTPAGSLAGLAAYQRATQQEEDGIPIAPGGNMAKIPQGAITRPEDIVWTDADNADADIPVLDELMEEARKTEGPWGASETVAKRQSKTTGKPMLIWFTNSQANFDKPLTTELFNRQDFEMWAKENVVRLRVDQGVMGATMNENTRKKDYVAKLKESYKVSGYPTLLVVSPSGEVVGRYKGFRKGQGDFKWGQIKQATGLANENYRKWRSDLEKKGYRDWTDTKDRTIFARMTAYKDGDLLLVEPDGKRGRTNEKKLSEDDREWIRKEKEKRGIQ